MSTNGGSTWSPAADWGADLVGNGLSGPQPSITSSSVFTIVAGQNVQFGIYAGNVTGNIVNADVSANLAYACY